MVMPKTRGMVKVMLRKFGLISPAFRRKKRMIFWSFVLLIFLLLISSGTYLYAFIQFFTKGDVVINIDSEEGFILTDKRDPKLLTFDVNIENRLFCRAKCEYFFKDISDNKMIDEGSFSALDMGLITKNYYISPPQKGTGQKAYEFYVQCKNEDNIFCVSGNEQRVKSSFATLAYELSTNEKELMDNTKEQLIQYLTKLNKLDLETQETIQKIKFYDDVFDFKQNLLILNINQSLTDTILGTENLKQFWQDEDIVSLREKIIVSENNLLKINESLSMLDDILLFKMNEYNLTSSSIEKYKSSFDDIEQIKLVIMVINQTNNLEATYLQSFKETVMALNNNSVNLSTANKEIKRLQQQYNFLLDDLFKELDLVVKEMIEQAEIEVVVSEGNINSTLNLYLSLCDSLMDDEIYMDLYIKYCQYETPLPTEMKLYNVSIFVLSEFTPSLEPRLSLDIYQHQTTCCIFGKCEPCCTDSCQKNENLYPLMLIHGHAVSEFSSISYSLSGFDSIRKQLVEDGYVDAGTILPQDIVDISEGYLGRFGKPVVVGTTYYVGVYGQNGTLISLPSKSESINTYARRLNQSIEIIKKKTGSDKVNILAYSMGGLVARQYLVNFGEESVNKLIMIGTPNKGVSGTIESFCPLVGSQQECIEMASTSSFINTLNNPKNIPHKVKTYAFVGKGCAMYGGNGDGTVLAESVELPYGLNFEIEGKCTQTQTLHKQLRDINKFPKIYSTLKTILSH